METGIPLLHEVTLVVPVPVVTVSPGLVAPLIVVSTSSIPSK
jgi:hypothetical protein